MNFFSKRSAANKFTSPLFANVINNIKKNKSDYIKSELSNYKTKQTALNSTKIDILANKNNISGNKDQKEEIKNTNKVENQKDEVNLDEYAKINSSLTNSPWVK